MSKHKNGYWPKIEYWTTQIRDEVFNTKKPQLNRVIYMNRSLQYFLDKQEELDNPIKQEEFSAVR
jgi:hypothetical protein